MTTLPAEPARRDIELTAVSMRIWGGSGKRRNPFALAAVAEPTKALHVPDVTGMSLLNAALAYAEAGWFVLPTDPADIKNPGSVVSGHWQSKSSRDADQIRRWWKANPNYGIALHCGRSGAIVFDLDLDSLKAISAYGRDDIATALAGATVVQGTRRDGDRGHYIFAMPPDNEFGNGGGAFKQYGEVRGKNGVIIAAPTPHPDAETKGGIYRQVRVGHVGPLPEVLRECLTEAGDDAEPLTDAELDAFLDAHTGGGCGREDCRHKIDGPVKNYNATVDGGASRYETLVAVMPWAFSEAVAGCYSAWEVMEAMRSAYNARFGPKDGDRLGRVAGEFLRVAKWAAAQADGGRAHRNDGNLKKPGRPNQATLLVDLALGRYKLGISPDGRTFAYREALPHIVFDLKGDKLGLRQQLAADYFDKHNSAASQTALASAMSTLEGMARREPPTPLNLRVAGDEKVIHIDMADEDNRVIEISGGTWRIVDSSPHKFRRTEVTAPLAEPVRGGDLGKLWRFQNIAKEDRPLMVAILVDALVQPTTPKPVTGLQAEHGSAKTSCARTMMSLVDPSTTGEPDGPPRNEDQWILIANASWVVALDNLSRITEWLSDAICRASTGAGDKKRTLYTNDSLTVHHFKRSVILTGIDMGGLRGDLTDRMVPIELQRIVKRLDEQTLKAEWDRHRADIFGGLLDLAAEVHAKLPGLQVETLPRMADFGRVLACVDEIAGTNGVARYIDRTQRAMADSATSDPFIEQLAGMRYDTGEYGQTAADILITVTNRRGTKPRNWPDNARNVTARLRRNAPAMRSMGWTVEEDGGKNKAKVVRWTIAPPCESDDEYEPD
jgi:Bifunctional DNA primase/polymerase, N-terminal